MSVETSSIPVGRNVPTVNRRAFGLSRLVRAAGYVAVLLALAASGATFLILMGLAPIAPTESVVATVLITNGALVVVLFLVVGWEVGALVLARRRGRAAARLHIRIVALFSIVAVIPAILVAVVASLTLDRGLDNWFSARTRSIVDNSVSIAQAYADSQVQALNTDIGALKGEVERARPLLLDDPDRFQAFFSSIVASRGLSGVFLVSADGTVVAEATPGSQGSFPKPPETALREAAATPTEAALIAPGATDMMGGVVKLAGYDDLYLYLIRPVDTKVLGYLATTNEAVREYRALEATRFGIQLAFGILYLGIALVVLLSAIWLGISLANRLVAPIRRLIDAAKQVSQGNLEVRVPARGSEGDLGALGDTFNTMTSQLRGQRSELLSANEQIDSRRRFTEAVLAGVTAGVVGIEGDGRIAIANRSALRLLGFAEEGQAIDKKVSDLIPELEPVVAAAMRDERPEQRDQITLMRAGRERTLNVRVTSEKGRGQARGYVITLDDITDLVTAQRSSAWADIARRIAHEIKNPLTPIQLSAERLRRKFGKTIAEDRDIFDQCTETIIRQVADIGRMVDEFSSFARMPKPAFEVRDLAESVKEAAFLISVAEPDIKFAVDLPDEPMLGRFDARLMGQALTNVIKNATEAIAALPAEQQGEGRIRVIGQNLDDSVVVDIIDNGIGLPAENRHRLLEPYMTTREKGTGLGLAIVTKIVEDHGGRVELLDSPEAAAGGRGALIRITLLRIAAETAPAERAEASPVASGF
jgi:two-component system nitrogen regulation sensor histidine kinase NtrY